MKEFSITKSTVESYKIRHSSGMYWADITIDAGDRSGRIQIASDYGSWQYYWGACGSSFKEFLIKLNIHYCADKFGCSRWFDFGKTILSYKKIVLDYRRQEYITPESARLMFDEIKLLDEEGPADSSAFQHYAYNEAPNFMKLMDYQPEISYDISPQFKKFWDEAWLVFIEELKREKAELVV